MSRKTRHNLLIAGGVLVVGFLVTAGLIKTRSKPARKALPVNQPLVTAYTISPALEQVHVSGFGTVKAKRSITVVPQVSGEILTKSPAFEPGSFVTAGDTLLQIDDTDYVLALAQAQANRAQAQYDLARAREEAEVAWREWSLLSETNQDSATPLVRHEPQIRLAIANEAAAAAAVRQATVDLERCTLRAPFDGQILTADADAGQYLRSGNAIGTIAATDIAEIFVSVPDADLAWITLGDPVVIAARFGGHDAAWEGRAVRLGGAVDTRSRLVPVVVEVPHPYHRQADHPALIEGTFVKVTFSATPENGSVIIPRSALRPGPEVWVVGLDGRLDLRPVTVSRAGIDRAVISAGLQPGERVCTSNLQYVTQGMPVRINEDTREGSQ